ncbi:MAG: hypothetical protein OXI88_10605 [Gammaproteobacteria bacterium]|nr:hypothetical protein [Gammaproteobacteria bacterium]
MQADEQKVLNIIGRMPEDSNMDEIIYRLYVLHKISSDQGAVKQGKTIAGEEFKREIDSW